MKILVVNGSPKGKRSNTLCLTNTFVKGIEIKAEEKGLSVEVEQLNVAELRIGPCKGCFACWQTTPGQCCLSDDMTRVIEALLWAEIIIWSFPLFYYNVPGVLKNLIDRQLPMALPFMVEREDGLGSGSHPSRYNLTGKKNVLISTCGFYSAEKNYDSVLRMFDYIWGKNNYEAVFCGQGELFSVQELSGRTDEYLKIVQKAGREFAGGNISLSTREELEELLYPKEVFEAMADASWGVDQESGEKEDESLVFTRQMAALYNKNAYDGKNRVLEICYTDRNVTYQIELGPDGSRVYTDGSRKYTTRIETPYSVWVKIARGEIRGDVALAEQLYSVKGDFTLMLNWDTFFGAQSRTQPTVGGGKAKKPPLMLTMLVPWIAFWLAVPIKAEIGALIVLTLGACWFMVLYRYEKTIYDELSLGLVMLLAVAVLATANTTIPITGSYLLFGAMWLGSCFTKEPLSVCYVKYRYNGNDALNNPIFMKANYILTACWGVLYILTAVWTWFLLPSRLSGYIVLINSIMPMLMGIFTVWFEQWYPSWVAGGRHHI